MPRHFALVGVARPPHFGTAQLTVPIHHIVNALFCQEALPGLTDWGQPLCPALGALLKWAEQRRSSDEPHNIYRRRERALTKATTWRWLAAPPHASTSIRFITLTRNDCDGQPVNAQENACFCGSPQDAFACAAMAFPDVEITLVKMARCSTSDRRRNKAGRVPSGQGEAFQGLLAAHGDFIRLALQRLAWTEPR